MWQTLLGIVISAGFLYWAVRGVHVGDILSQVSRANPVLFAASVLIVTLTFPARAVRWRLLLAAATRTMPPLGAVWHATAIGFMANNVLPARAGELARAYAGSKLVGLPVSTALSTIAVERVFDGVVVVVLLALGIAAPGFPADVTVGGWSLSGLAALMGAVFFVALIVLGVAAHFPERALAISDRLARALLPSRAANWIAGVARHLFDGLSVLRSPRDFGRVLGWSFVVWGLNVVSYAFAFGAFHLDLPVTSALVLQGIVVLGVAIPSSPGYVGLFEAACVAALGVYGVAQGPAVGFAIALHMAWFIPITVLGVWSLLRAGLSMRELGGRREAAA